MAVEDPERIAVRMIAEDALRQLGRPVTDEAVIDFLCGMVLRMRPSHCYGYNRDDPQSSVEPPVFGAERKKPL